MKSIARILVIFAILNVIGAAIVYVNCFGIYASTATKHHALYKYHVSSGILVESPNPDATIGPLPSVLLGNFEQHMHNLSVLFAGGLCVQAAVLVFLAVRIAQRVPTTGPPR
jgi:hypothetical protein